MQQLVLRCAAILALVAGIRAPALAGPVGRDPAAGAAVAVWRGGVAVFAVPAGLDRCCPHRISRVGIVRTGGLSGGPPGSISSAPVEACDACDDWEVCAAELEGVEASMQVVPLRNGVMRVFTAETAAGARVVQAALARHYDRMSALIQAGENAHLCAACRALRGAAVSGKLAREIIKIEGGCITLTTSTDPAVVTRIHADAGVPPPPGRPRL